MPNWTFNTITVRGNKESLKKMMADARVYPNGSLSLSSWFPVPETFIKYDTTNHPDGKGLKVGEEWWDGLGKHEGVVTEELIQEFKDATREQREKYGVVGWYDYNCKMYGVKWDSELTVESKGETEIVLAGDTPWSAPDAWLMRMSEKYPDLVFENHAEYEEGFWEDTVYENGDGDQVGTGEMDWGDDDEEEQEETE